MESEPERGRSQGAFANSGVESESGCFCEFRSGVGVKIFIFFQSRSSSWSQNFLKFLEIYTH